MNSFNHIWAWRHLEFQIMTHFSLILYIYHINAKHEISLKLASYFHRKYEIWLHLAQWFQRRSRLKKWTDDGQRTDDRGFPYYKLPQSLQLRGAKTPTYNRRNTVPQMEIQKVSQLCLPLFQRLSNYFHIFIRFL